MTKPHGRPGKLAALAITIALVTIGAGLMAGPAGATKRSDLHDGADAAGALDIRDGTVAQNGDLVTLRVSTAKKFSLGQLKLRPQFGAPGAESFLCVELTQKEKARFCFGVNSHGKAALYRAPISKTLAVGKWAAVQGARVSRSSPHGVTAQAQLTRFGLHPGHFLWRVLSDNSYSPCVSTPAACADVAPNSGSVRGKIHTPRTVGCTAGHHGVVFHGGRKHRRVALTFDDGPSSYTSRILTTLRRNHVHATFFVIGQEISGRQGLLRRELRDGNEIGNHTMHHQENASSGDLAATSKRIKNATGFKPCSFRPPDGAINGGLASRARGQGMSSILWDIDTRDWSLPGSGAIGSRAKAAHSGSIVIMHDGGGPRGETADALPSIIHSLRHRGFRFVTVTQMLGGHNILRP